MCKIEMRRSTIHHSNNDKAKRNENSTLKIITSANTHTHTHTRSRKYSHSLSLKRNVRHGFMVDSVFANRCHALSEFFRIQYEFASKTRQRQENCTLGK